MIEAAVLNEMLPQLVTKRDRNPAIVELRERIAETARLRDADQERLNNLVDALADGGSKAIMQRVGALEAKVETYERAIDTAQQALDIELSKPCADDDVEAIESLRSELNHADDEVRSYARGRVNMSLRRLIKRIAITNVGTFRIEPDVVAP